MLKPKPDFIYHYKQPFIRRPRINIAMVLIVISTLLMTGILAYTAIMVLR